MIAVADIILEVDSSRPATVVTLGGGIVVLLAAKSAANFRPRYVNSLRSYLGLFARGRENMPIADITVEVLELWFASRKEAPSSQRGNLGRLGSLFAFAERRFWITRNPMRQLEKIRIDRKPPKILTVEQAERLMEWAMRRYPKSLAFFTLALFGGIRPQELEAVTWENVGAGIVTVDAAASKVRRRRIVHLNENAIEWLNFARELGALLPFGINKRVRTLQKAAVHLGFEAGWCQDILRHSCASYWLATRNDVGAVSRELGNSPSILLNHYFELVSAESALAFWSIRP